MKVFRMVVLTAMSVMPLTLTAPSSAQAARTAQASLPGSWVVAATPDPIFLCNGPQIAPAPAPFTELATYDEAGGLIETNTILNANSATLPPGNLPFNASDGFGAWEQEKSGQFKAKFRKLVFDVAGVYVAKADVRESLALDASRPSKFSGTFTIKFIFLDGSPAVCSSGKLVANKIPVD